MPTLHDEPDIYDRETGQKGARDGAPLNDEERADFDDLARRYDEEVAEPDYYKDQKDVPDHPGGQTGKGDSGKSGKDAKGKLNKGDDDGGLYKSSNQTEPKSRLARGRARIQKAAANNKKKLAAVMAGATPIVIFIILAFVLFGNLKIVHYYKTMLAYNFARMNRVSEIATDEVLSSADELRAANDTTYRGKLRNLGDDLGKKLDRISPNRTLRNMGRDGNLEFKYRDAESRIPGRRAGELFARQELASVRVGPNEIAAPTPKLRDWVSNPLETYKEGLSFKGSLKEALSKELSQENWYVRSKVSKQVFEDMGVKLRWFERLTKSYKSGKEAIANGESVSKADDLENQERSVERAKQPPTESAVSDLSDITKESSDAIKTCVTEAKCGKEMLESGVSEDVATAIGKAGVESGFKKAVGFFSGAYAVAVPLCLIFEGTDSNSMQKIDSTDRALTLLGIGFMSAADQMTAGDATSRQVATMARQLGDTSGSVVDQRNAVNGKVGTVDPGPESNVSGGYGTPDGVLGTVANSSLMTFFTDPQTGLCQYITNVWVGVGLGVAETLIKGAIAFFTAGTGAEAAQAGEVAAEEAVGTVAAETAGQVGEVVAEKVVAGLAEDVAAKAAEKAAEGSLSRQIMLRAFKDSVAGDLRQMFSKSTAKKVAAETALIFLARGIVLANLQNGHDGTNTKASALDEKDQGLNVYASKVGRGQTYGRPLSGPEEVSEYVNDRTYLASKEKEQSTFDRYLAMNGTSLLSNVGVTANTTLIHMAHNPTEWVGALSRSFGNALHSVASVFTNFGSAKVAYALDPSVVNPYHITQFAWTADEMSLLQTPDYAMERNKVLLGGDEQKVHDKYDKCFDEQQESLGAMIKDELIVRNTDGTIKPDKGLCAPNALGPFGNDPEVGGVGKVFRYRVKKLYDKQLDHMLDTQEVEPDDDTAGGTPAADPANPQTIGQVTCPATMEANPTHAGYFKMPTAPNHEYTIYSTDAHRFGSKELVCVLYTVGLAYSHVYPGKSMLYIGDLNATGHRSHKWGVAVDVDGGGQIAAADHTGHAIGTYSTEATIALGKLFIDTGVIRNLWWCDPGDGSLNAIKAYAASKGKPLQGAKCIAGHENHFHVDIDAQFRLPGEWMP